MLFIVTNRQDQTADFLITELRRRKVDYFRFNTEDFSNQVNAMWCFLDGKFFGKFETKKRIIHFNEISSIWYRRPVPPFIDKSISDPEEIRFIIDENKYFLDGIWKTIDCFWVSKPDALAKAENKLFQLKTADEIGFEIWPTLVTNPQLSLTDFYTKQKDIIYKPLRRGKINRDGTIGLIFTNKILPEHEKYFSNINLAAGLFQKYIPKLVEIRVTVIGQQVFAVEIHSQKHKDTLIDWRRANSDSIFHKFHSLPPNIESCCKKLVTKLDIQFGAIDLILTPDGKYVFLEINPNGQWAWIQQLCPEIPLRETLIDLLISKENGEYNEK